MSDKATKTTKADLLKMLSEAVRNTPGATPIEPVLDVQPEPKGKRGSEPERVVEIRRGRAPSMKAKKPLVSALRAKRRRLSD